MVNSKTRVEKLEMVAELINKSISKFGESSGIVDSCSNVPYGMINFVRIFKETFKPSAIFSKTIQEILSGFNGSDKNLDKILNDAISMHVEVCDFIEELKILRDNINH